MKHINLRLPDDLHAKVVEAAKDDHRSVNSLLVVLIERALNRDRPTSPR